jgi:hypothetical protein
MEDIVQPSSWGAELDEKPQNLSARQSDMAQSIADEACLKMRVPASHEDGDASVTRPNHLHQR